MNTNKRLKNVHPVEVVKHGDYGWSVPCWARAGCSNPKECDGVCVDADGEGWCGYLEEGPFLRATSDSGARQYILCEGPDPVEVHIVTELIHRQLEAQSMADRYTTEVQS